MPSYFETALPSGRCARVRVLETADELAILDRVERKQKLTGSTGTADTLRENALAALVAYTEPVPLVLVDEERTIRGEQVMRKVIDVDATLAKVPETAWIPVTHESLITAGPGHLLTIFKRGKDFAALSDLIDQAKNGGEDLPSALGKARAVASSGPSST